MLDNKVETKKAEAGRIEFRRITLRDLPDVFRIEAAAFRCSGAKRACVSCRDQRQCKILVGVQGESVRGFVFFENLTMFANVIALAVDPPFQRSGIGTALLQAVRDLQTRPTMHLRLAVHERNLPAQLFCRAIKLRAIKCVPEYFGQDHGAIIFADDSYAPAPSISVAGTPAPLSTRRQD